MLGDQQAILYDAKVHSAYFSHLFRNKISLQNLGNISYFGHSNIEVLEVEISEQYFQRSDMAVGYFLFQLEFRLEFCKDRNWDFLEADLKEFHDRLFPKDCHGHTKRSSAHCHILKARDQRFWHNKIELHNQNTSVLCFHSYSSIVIQEMVKLIVDQQSSTKEYWNLLPEHQLLSVLGTSLRIPFSKYTSTLDKYHAKKIVM